MKIAPPIDTAAAPAPTPAGSATARAGGGNRGPARAAAFVPSGDKSATVRPSAAATPLQSVTFTPEFNAEKVQTLRKAIEDGTFEVNANVIAERLLGHARELLRHHVSH